MESLIERKNLTERNQNTTERSVIVDGTHTRVKSVFAGRIPLEKALGNLALRKLSDGKIS